MNSPLDNVTTDGANNEEELLKAWEEVDRLKKENSSLVEGLENVQTELDSHQSEKLVLAQQKISLVR